MRDIWNRKTWIKATVDLVMPEHVMPQMSTHPPQQQDDSIAAAYAAHWKRPVVGTTSMPVSSVPGSLTAIGTVPTVTTMGSMPAVAAPPAGVRPELQRPPTADQLEAHNSAAADFAHILHPRSLVAAGQPPPEPGTLVATDGHTHQTLGLRSPMSPPQTTAEPTDTVSVG